MFTTPLTSITHSRVERAIYWEKMWAWSSLYPSEIDLMVKIW